MIVMYKRSLRVNGRYPLIDREKFVKLAKNIKCELYLINDWSSEHDIYKAHREFDKLYPRLANNYSNKEIKDSIEKWVKLGYINKRVS